MKLLSYLPPNKTDLHTVSLGGLPVTSVFDPHLRLSSSSLCTCVCLCIYLVFHLFVLLLQSFTGQFCP